MPKGYILKCSGERTWDMAEYWCDACRWLGESLERMPARPAIPCEKCGAPAERCISAAKWKTVWGWAQRGKNSKDDIPPGALNTEALADGMTSQDFHSMRKKMRADRRRARVRKMVS